MESERRSWQSPLGCSSSNDVTSLSGSWEGNRLHPHFHRYPLRTQMAERRRATQPPSSRSPTRVAVKSPWAEASFPALGKHEREDLAFCCVSSSDSSSSPSSSSPASPSLLFSPLLALSIIFYIRILRILLFRLRSLVYLDVCLPLSLTPFSSDSSYSFCPIPHFPSLFPLSLPIHLHFHPHSSFSIPSFPSLSAPPIPSATLPA